MKVFSQAHRGPSLATEAALNIATLGAHRALRPAEPPRDTAEPLTDLRVQEPILVLLDREFRKMPGGSIEHKPIDKGVARFLQVQYTVARAEGLEIVLLQVPGAILKDGNQIRSLLMLSHVLRGKVVRLLSLDLEGDPSSAFNGLQRLWQENDSIQVDFVPLSHLEELEGGRGDLWDVLKFSSRPGAPSVAVGNPVGTPHAGAATDHTVRIFIASSAELRDDRDEFDRYFREQNDQLRVRSIYLEVNRWESSLGAMSKTGLQDQYNEAVRACDIFVCLFFTKAGEFTAEEFEVAHSQFQGTGKPVIYTYFKNAPVNAGDLGDEVKSLLAFKDKLRELKHYPSIYNDIEHLKLQFREQLDKLIRKWGW